MCSCGAMYGIHTGGCSGEGFTVLSPLQQQGTLIAGLVPCADTIRDLKTSLGARPYRVALVRTRWSGTERGVGVEEVTSDEPILPTPKVSALTALQATVQSNGLDELGQIQVTEISARYTENCLRGLGPLGEAPEDNEQFYWEIAFPQTNGADLRRRFALSSAPTLDAVNFQWRATLVKTGEDRARNGDPQG